MGEKQNIEEVGVTTTRRVSPRFRVWDKVFIGGGWRDLII